MNYMLNVFIYLQIHCLNVEKSLSLHALIPLSHSPDGEKSLPKRNRVKQQWLFIDTPLIRSSKPCYGCPETTEGPLRSFKERDLH